MRENNNQTTHWNFGELWCNAMHDSAMWPIHGEYQCRTCGRKHPVPWEAARTAPSRSMGASLQRAVLPLIVLFALVAPVARAADQAMVDASAPQVAAFARYIAGLDQARPWSLETVEIEASLPKLKKAGSLRALRRLLPAGKPQYQVLDITGDETVKQRVIFRYLSEEVQAAEIAPSTVAITPANYKFRYSGVANQGGRIAYVFRITPLHKRVGLIQGELWLDAESGAPVRQSGRFVKSPSVLVKHVDITREGTSEARLTHITVTARFVGTAELRVMERPVDNAGVVLVAGMTER